MSTPEQAVTKLEQLIGAKLPEDYRSFLLVASPDALEGQSYWMPHPEGSWIETVDQFFTVERLLTEMPAEIELRRKGFADYPAGSLPISDNGCGDTVLLSYRDQDFGTVYHKFHEEGDGNDPQAGVYRLASSFTDWLEQLETFSEDDEAS